MEEDLRSSGAGLRGFKSHPRHHYARLSRGLIFSRPLYLSQPTEVEGQQMFFQKKERETKLKKSTIVFYVL
jgi:hypothetical protein